MSLVCSWNEVGDVPCQVPQAPFCTRPFWRMPSHFKEYKFYYISWQKRQILLGCFLFLWGWRARSFAETQRFVSDFLLFISFVAVHANAVMKQSFKPKTILIGCMRVCDPQCPATKPSYMCKTLRSLGSHLLCECSTQILRLLFGLLSFVCFCDFPTDQRKNKTKTTRIGTTIRGSAVWSVNSSPALSPAILRYIAVKQTNI